MDTNNLNPMATGHIPSYLPGPDGSDPLFMGIAIFTVVLIVAIGGLYFRLHALPEQMAHHGNHTQFQVVGILALLALFTHNNIFWVAALLLAAFRMPDFLTPLESIADSLRLQGLRPQPHATEHVRTRPTSAPPETIPDGPRPSDPASGKPETPKGAEANPQSEWGKED